MTDVINLYNQALALSKTAGKEVEQKFGVSSEEEPSDFFSMAHNNAVIALELLSFYTDTWQKLSQKAGSFSPAEVAKLRDDNSDRVMLMQKCAS
jgi:hypothetical protein